MRRTRIVPGKERPHRASIARLPQRRAGHRAPFVEGGQIFARAADEHRLQAQSAVDMLREFDENCPPARSSPAWRPGVNDRVRLIGGASFDRPAERPRSRARHLRDRHAQIKHRARHCSAVWTRRVIPRISCAVGIGRVVDQSGLEYIEPGTESRARKQREPRAARTAVQVQAQCRFEYLDRGAAAADTRAYIGFLKHIGEAVFRPRPQSRDRAGLVSGDGGPE